MKNSGAIEFLESKWTAMNPLESLDLMIWLNDNLEPGYQILKFGENKSYFIGESDTLFDSTSFNQNYEIYQISTRDSKFTLTKTSSLIHT